MRVLLATDGSPMAGVAVDLVAAIPWPSPTTIRVVGAVEQPASIVQAAWSAVSLGDAFADEAVAAAGRTVKEVAERLARPEITLETAVLDGRPAARIVEEAERIGADLIVVGSRGHGPIERMLLGSVSAEVIDHSPIPVLVARRSGFGTVALAWDGSDGASRAASLLKDWEIFRSSRVHVVSVVDPGYPWWTGFPSAEIGEIVPMYLDSLEEMRKEHEALARGMADQLRSKVADVTNEARRGDAAAEIIRSATEAGADLIAMGSRGRTGLARLVLGSVARNVLHHAPCSVLVVPDRDHPRRTE